MKQNFIAAFSFLILFLLSVTQIVHAQQTVTPTRMIPAVSFFISGDYFAPKFDDVNAVYRAIEKNYFLPAGNDFKNYYDVTGGIRFSPIERQTIQLELATSLYKSPLGNSLQQVQSKNFLQMYYTGGTYLVNFPVGHISLFVGAGFGYMWLNTQRTYANQTHAVYVNAQLFQVHGTAGIEFFHSSGVSVSLEGGYSYASTPSPARSDLDFTLQGFTVGIKATVPLVNKL